MKIKNQEITFNILDKNRNVVYTNTKKNRIVDNCLDWVLFHQLPNGIGGSTFSKFVNIEQPDGSGLNKKLATGCYIKFTTKDTIDDTSTNFNFDLVDYPGNIYYLNYSGSGNIAEATESYEFEITSTYADQLLTQVGFGLFDIDVNIAPFNDWLMAWIDVDLLGIRIPEGFFLQVQRKDYATNLKNVDSSEGSMYILQEQAKISNVELLDENDSVIEAKSISELTVTNTATGEIELSGFSDYNFSTGALYPSDTLYPSNSLYPDPGNLKKVRIYYEPINLVTQNEFYVEYNAIDLDISYDGDTITLKIIIERGDI